MAEEAAGQDVLIREAVNLNALKIFDNRTKKYYAITGFFNPKIRQKELINILKSIRINSFDKD